ncbi:unnamed protein product [Urochloa decumbens]|uniref:F-box domain-containing protein n=1 Tax=Urochloa decumbens TaxID=240449 RepID=A0ABC9C4F8_9POAL
MPPRRRSSSRAHPDASCQPPEKEKNRPCRRRRGRRAPGVGTLPDDVLSAIFSRVPSGAAGVARCAAACRRWARVVATRAAAIARALPQPRPAGFLPHLALGVLHGPQIRGTRTRRKPVVSIAASGGSPSLRLDGGGGLFDSARSPVASRNGRVVLELRREDRADGLTLCVCNPMAGPPDDAAVLPALAGNDCPGYYACAMLTADDLDATVTVAPSFFRVLLVYNRRSFTALRCYSSDAGSWGPERRKPGAKMSARTLQQLGPAAVVRGVAYWPATHRAAFGVRLDDGGGTTLLDVCWVPYRMPDFLPDFRLLGVSPDGERLSYISAGRTLRRYLMITVETLQLQGVEEDTMMMSTAAGRWDTHAHISLPQFEVPGATALKLRWFGDKSGTLVFTIGEGGNTSGAFALNLATSSVEKLADGVHCNSWTNLCGYEMDRATLLALVAARFF